MPLHAPLRRTALAAAVAVALGLSSAVAAPALADDLDATDGDATLAGQVVSRPSPDGPPGDTGIPGLDVTVYVDDDESQRPIALLDTDDEGRFQLDVSVDDGEQYTFSVRAQDDDYFFSFDPLAVVTDLDDADWIDPPQDAPYILGVYEGTGPTPTPTPIPTPPPTPTPTPTQTPAPTVSVSGTVSIAGGTTPIAGATVTVSVGGTGYGPVNTDTEGKYTLPAVPVGAAVIHAIAPNFSTDERPVTLTAGTNATGQNLFLVAKKPAESTNSIAGTVVLTSDLEDGLLFAGELTLVQDGKTVQTTTASDGAFVFEKVTATGDLRVVVPTPPAGYEQKTTDGFVYNYEGTRVDHLTIRLAPTAEPEPDPVPAPAAADLTWLVVVLILLLLAVAITVIVLLIRRRNAAAKD